MRKNAEQWIASPDPLEWAADVNLESRFLHDGFNFALQPFLQESVALHSGNAPLHPSRFRSTMQRRKKDPAWPKNMFEA